MRGIVLKKLRITSTNLLGKQHLNLNLSHNQIAEIKGLCCFYRLTCLKLSSNQITKIKGLDNLIKLQKLYLEVKRITEVSGLDNLRKLRYMDLYHNQITELKVLKHLAKLKLLSLEENNIPPKVLEQCVEDGVLYFPSDGFYPVDAQKCVDYF